MGSSFECQYDGILGRDFWENKEATINYCDRTIIMGEVLLDFDNKTDRAASKHCKLTLKARNKHIVKLPTKFKVHGVISKKELVPGIFLAESLTMGYNGYCVISIVNALGKEVTIDPPLVELEETEDDFDNTVLIFTNSVVEDNGRIAKLRDEIRTDHLNSEARVSLIKLLRNIMTYSTNRRQTDVDYGSRTPYSHSNYRPNAGNEHETLQNP
jgi:hypothetical protein